MTGSKQRVSWDDLFPGRFLKAGNIAPEGETLTIADIRTEEIDDKRRVVLRFAEKTLEYVCCVTNGLALRAAFGDDATAYVGKRVHVVSRRVDSFGELVDAIRIDGSPDIAAAVDREFKRGSGARTKKIRIKLTKTGDK